MAAEAAVAASGAAAVAAGTFSYNRENYMWDQENRWERFTSAREYANQQAEQFRADLRAMAGLTAKKSTIWCIMSSLTMALCVALYCAGRLGLHGPSPPAWIMGLWLTNNAAAFAFMALTMFLAMHAGFRAQAASTQLLTRKVRVPVPTLAQLDLARRFASEFEQQDLQDIFRIPLVTNNGAPQTDDAVNTSEVGRAGDRAPRSQSAPPGRRGACSSWIREEFEHDRAFNDKKGVLPPDTVPDHFRLFEQVQKEYYEHDIYARVSVFYGFIHYVQSLGYYGLGHINIELRAFFVAFGCVFVIAVLQALLLRFDIYTKKDKREWLQNCEYLGPIALMVAAVAMAIDFYKKFDPYLVTLCWVLIFVAYILQLIYSVRMFLIVLPDEKFKASGDSETLGDTWLPKGWRTVPSSFYHVWYFVAPPTKLQKDQYDLVREVKDGGVGAYEQVVGDVGCSERRELDPVDGPLFKNSAHIRPYRLVARIALVLPVSWVFLIGGCIMDVIFGEQAFVTAPHWSRPPMTRLSLEPHELGTPLGFPWPSGARPYLPEQMAWHEEKRHAGSFHIRRLQTRSENTVAFPEAIKNLVTAIDYADKVAAAQADVAHISWPGFFEPKIMACGQKEGRIAALTPRGFGAVTQVGRDGERTVESFKLAGLTHLPALLSASWGLEKDEGLLTVSRAGHLAACSGVTPAAGGVWTCTHSLPQLPVAEGARIDAASAAWLSDDSLGFPRRRLHAAMVVDGAPDLVGLFVHEAGSWLPLGEVRVPSGRKAKISLSFVDGSDLLVATEDHVIRRNLQSGQVVLSSTNAHARGGSSKEWQGSCSLPKSDGRVAHLHLQRTASSGAWRPELTSVKLS